MASAQPSGLEKAEIRVVEGPEKDDVEVLFNPAEYDLQKSVNYGTQEIAGLTTPLTQFVHGEARTLSMELFFDTYEDGGDVREETKKIDDLLAIDGQLHAPPIVKFVWGPLSFTSVVESVDERFTMFRPNGEPVRARVNVTFREYESPEEQAKEPPRKSGDKTTVWRVTQGDTLWAIAAAEYGDPGAWRPIAEANDVANPRDLRRGAELVVPSLDR